MSPLKKPVVLDNDVVSRLYGAGTLRRALEVWPKSSFCVTEHVIEEARQWRTEGQRLVALLKELEAEGIAREVVRRLQTMRRSAGLDIADHIITYYEGGDSVHLVMTRFADYIKQETLSRELISAVPPAGSHTEKFRISNYEISLGIEKTA